MKKYGVWLGIGTFAAAALTGCGGGGTGTTFALGRYFAEVTETNRSSLVDITVTPQGTANGTCTLRDSTTGEVLGTAVLSGSVHTSTGDLNISGMYECLNPSSGSTISGAVAITGTVPAKGVATGPIHLDDNGTTFHGVISMSPPI